MKKSKMFLDPKQPLYTCGSSNCEGCPVSKDLNCHFALKQLIRFLAIVLPPAVVGGYGIFIYKPLLIIVWISMFIIYFGFVEIRVMCSHCPHYAEPNLKSLKCWANYGIPKLWKYRPGPMSLMEKIIFSGGALIIFTFPIPLLILKSGISNLILLGVYIVLIITSFLLLKRYYCSQCINFACPLNNVDKETREKFFLKNKVVKDAWKKL
jgi:hypothetical protein